ncbi:MAG: hypothetical protein ACXWZS_16745 [Gemmatirosa sp.]
MADERTRERGAGDEREQDGLGRDAAHGGGPDATTGGSYGRSTGRAGEGDLLETGAGSGGRRSEAQIPRGTDEQSSDSGAGDEDTMDPDVTPDVSRRDPMR